MKEPIKTEEAKQKFNSLVQRLRASSPVVRGVASSVVGLGAVAILITLGFPKPVYMVVGLALIFGGYAFLSKSSK